ncbi:hypothetical protein OS493_029445 [Desmophyllum pertusum]|uniref:BHLH domain-containing protein n=1 Tax=Desmophyllum pertusum TaxID=174260 RepID=A0A9W9YLK5_9CNID|nr:hypothetical protein OS493_029445 [Desmophyllum pertusum]
MAFQAHDETSDFVSKIRVERRKAQKPRIEKLRRDRINCSLDEIKHLVLEALNKDISRYSKMEKADILEMTVQFLRGTQAGKRMQTGIRSRVEHTAAELKDTSYQERHLTAAPQIPCQLTQDRQLLMGMPADVKPIPMLSPFVPASMVAMAPQPTIVWLPYPSPPPSPTEQTNEVADSAIKQCDSSRTGNENGFPRKIAQARR